MKRSLAHFTGGGPLDGSTHEVEGCPVFVRFECAHPDATEYVTARDNPMAAEPNKLSIAVYELTDVIRSDGAADYRFIRYEDPPTPRDGGGG